MEKKTIIPFPCYNYRIYVIFTEDIIASADNLTNQGKLERNHGVDDTTNAFTVKMPNQSYTFMVFKNEARVSDIVHECYHAICSMLKWIGANHEEEVVAYSLGYLVGLVLKDQEKVKNSKKSVDKRKKR